MKRFVHALIGGVSILGVLAIGALVFVKGHGFSASAKPSALETAIAVGVRNLAIPDTVRDLSNPIPRALATVDAGAEHFREHCASCHADDGSGRSEMGQNLYPPVPDMRLDRTQSLTDGQLFYIIQNGVPFTGMPGWGNGNPEVDEHAWHLVRFIRQLPVMAGADADTRRVAAHGDAVEAVPRDPRDAQSAENAPHEHHHGHAVGE